MLKYMYFQFLLFRIAFRGDVSQYFLPILEDPIGHRDDLSETEKASASNTVKRHGVYTQVARILRVSTSKLTLQCRSG